ncbi:hypothetical protein [Haloarchaeobius sp. HRN-SO-5]|uniref:hypothetical protein n=1 Tax=Haloarchaeobius sp. HRN-SO-5 TaxID=3446118 RepID=UPI003EBCCCD5
MDRRTVIANGLSTLSILASSGCLFGINGSRASELRIETEPVTMTQICERSIRTFDKLDRRDENHVEDVIESNNSSTSTEFTFEEEIYLQFQDKYYHVSVNEEGENFVYSLELIADSVGKLCEVIIRQQVIHITHETVNENIYDTIHQAVDTSQFRSSPLNDSAVDTYDFLTDNNYGGRNYPFYIRFREGYYKVTMSYDSGE